MGDLANLRTPYWAALCSQQIPAATLMRCNQGRPGQPSRSSNFCDQPAPRNRCRLRAAQVSERFAVSMAMKFGGVWRQPNQNQKSKRRLTNGRAKPWHTMAFSRTTSRGADLFQLNAADPRPGEDVQFASALDQSGHLSAGSWTSLDPAKRDDLNVKIDGPASGYERHQVIALDRRHRLRL